MTDKGFARGRHCGVEDARQGRAGQLTEERRAQARRRCFKQHGSLPLFGEM